jgi:CRISPR-associated protein Cmr6
LALNADEVRCIDALCARQTALALSAGASKSVLTLDVRAVAPFTTGLGNEHPLENGFAFLNPYGLPYLPGSGVKGVLRQAARELQSGEWGEARGWTEDAITHLFGMKSDDGDKIHQRGALSFWDVLPQVEGNALQVDVMTPHQSHYYQQRREARSGDSTAPHDSGQPNPIHFVTVSPGSRFAFHVQCDLPFLERLDASLANGNRWQELLQSAFEHAFAWLGFGAKTAVGYGAMTEDPQARRRREDARNAADAAAAAQAEQARIESLSPEDRDWALAQPDLEQFRIEFEKAKAAGAYIPGGPFNQSRQTFVKKALAWTEGRSRTAAAALLEQTATKNWGRPSNKERWAELQAAIQQLKGGT